MAQETRVGGGGLTILSSGLGMRAALSRSSLYSSSSQSRCSVFSGSFSSTGMATLDRSFPMLFRRMLHTLTLLVLGPGAGRLVLLLDLVSSPLSRTGPERTGNLIDSGEFLFLFHHLKSPTNMVFPSKYRQNPVTQYMKES